MPREDDVRRIVSGGRERGLSDDQIRALVARYDQRQAEAQPQQQQQPPGSGSWAHQKLAEKYGPEVAAQIANTEVMGQAMPPPGVLSFAGKAAKAATRAVPRVAEKTIGILDNPLVGGSIGAVEGYQHGGLGGAAVGFGLGASSGTQLARGLRRSMRRLAPKPAAAPSPAPVPAAAATPAQALHREVMARDIDWRTVDAVPIDAIKRDVTRGGSIIEAGESRIALGERLARAVKTGDKAEIDRLAKAIRQREHISEKAGR